MNDTVLITGGAGFIGTNLAHRLLSEGRAVRVFDNLSRPGVERNLRWLRSVHGQRLSAVVADIRDRYSLRACLKNVSQVFHLAAQVAVTTSLAAPVSDFEVNARGTLNLLEEIRALERRPALVFTSTNKVYGNLDDLPLARQGTRYSPNDTATAQFGINESRRLDFHSPYGCSKGAADQYVLDYARIYGLPAVVFRMSCIYGPHQFGTEDQGWVAHFLIRALEHQPVTLYGDGLQVRDLLYIDDLVDAFVLAQRHMAAIAGRAFNIGGGPENAVSLVELLDRIRLIHGHKPRVRSEMWRAADQRYYVSDTRRFRAASGWAPRIGLRDGVARLYGWLAESRGLPLVQKVAS